MRAFQISLAIAGIVLYAAETTAHSVHHEIEGGRFTLVTFTHHSGAPFAGASYDLYGPTDSVVVESGTTNGKGQIVIHTDRAGMWRVKVFSTDGHGADITFNVDTAGKPERATIRPRTANAVLGIGIILSVYGTAAMLYRRRRS